MSSIEILDDQVEALDEEFLNYNTDADTTCTICQAEFLDPDDLTTHLEQIHKVVNSDERLCDFCSKNYTDLITYAEHLRDKHLTKLNYCQHCLRAFLDYDDLRVHEKKHKATKKPSFTCTQCNKKFGNVIDLKKHDFENHNNNVDGVMMQPYLPYLSAVLNVKADTILQSLQADTVYICVSCEYSTADIDIYIKHARSGKCTSFVCSTCSNVYKRKDNIKRHLLNPCDSISGGKSIKCPDCHLVINKYLFPLHKKSCKIIKCYTCGIRYDTMYELSEHQSTEHPLSVELKSCTYCWKECVGSVALQKHIDRSHKGQLHLYKYICIYCKTPFKHPQKLFGHFFSKHKDLEPYTCKICDQKFKLRKKFTLHIKLEHKSVGFVEFDKNYNVFFTDKKSENPFVPKSVYEDQMENQKDTSLVNSQDSNIELLNINSEMSVTETEGNQTEVESVSKPALKRKKVVKSKIVDEEPIQIQSSDDEPLLVVKKRVQKAMPKVIRNRWTKKRLTSINKKRFTCNICKKYCYTYQNYNHHITLHSKKDYKKCIKCSKVFRSKEKLNNHIAREHSSSRLTETLKYLLEKRKTGGSITDDLPMSEKFRRTIRKVECEEITYSTATISTVENGLSVQKFIENFSPEGETKPEPDVEQAVSIKIVTGPPKKPAIKMTRFQSKPLSSTPKLSMPVRFKENSYFNKTVASIRLVQPTAMFNIENQGIDFQNYDDADGMDRNDSIPEVAEEVMLEGTEETPKVTQIPHKIVIPKLPVEYKDIRIAHLLPQAPFYKIVKVNEVLNLQDIEKNDTKNNKSTDTIKLPDGTKLVNSNPLAHLLGKRPLEKILEPIKNKYYKPRNRDVQSLLAEALSNLDKPPKKKKKENPEIAESVTSESTSNN